MQCEYDADIDARLDICQEHGVFIHHDVLYLRRACPRCNAEELRAEMERQEWLEETWAHYFTVLP